MDNGSVKNACDVKFTPQSKLHGSRILIVEDEAIAAMFLADSLSDAGAEIVGVATTVTESFQILAEALTSGGLHAAILDLNLWGESIEPVAKDLKMLGVPFFIITGYDINYDSSDIAAVQIFYKVFDTKEFIAAIKTIISPTSMIFNQTT